MIDNAVSLFAGIGGFDLALDRAGVTVNTTVEIDKSCRGVLERHFPWAYIYPDVTEITGDYFNYNDFNPETGILTAGWPCQGNSVAGRRGGMDDPRSALWGQVSRLLAETRPAWFLGENVPGLLTVNGGRDFWQVVNSLDELGYGVAWRVLDAQYFGIPQRRKRVFIVGCLGDGASPAEILFDADSMFGDSAASSEAGAQATGAVVVSTLQGGGKRGYRVDAEGAAGGHLVVGALDAHEGPHGHGGANVQSALAGHYLPTLGFADGLWGVRRLTPLECERLQGFPDGWTAGQSDSARYRQLGNAVAVPCVQWIVNRIVNLEATSNQEAA